MKRLLMLLWMIFFFTAKSQSQVVTTAEYFVDTDPGPGNGVPVTIATPADIVNFSATIPTISLSAGFHFVGIRVKDANGRWGPFEKRGFYISSSTLDAPNITAAEYFFDADPGAGNGTAISVGASGAVVNFAAVIPVSLSAGFHFLTIRVRDSNGTWGSFEKRGFFISSNTSDMANIVAAEYFFDADPGFGNGTPTPVGTAGGVVNFTAVIPPSLSAGFHFLAIRTKDANGLWGHFDKRGFYISGTATDAANIVAAEYFFDTDPGAGNGTPTSVGATGAVVNFAAVIPTSLTAGFHFLAIRTKDANGMWGLFEKRGFYISTSTIDASDIVAAEYFFDADPGVGNGTPTSVGTTGAVVNFTAVIPNSLTAGFHFLAIRTKGLDGKWGLYDKRGFYISTSAANSPIIVAAEYFFDADPGVGNATSLSVTTPGDIVTQTFLIPEPGLSLGTHNLSIRAKGQDGRWGLYEYRSFTIGNSSISCPSSVSVNAAAGQCTAVVNAIDPTVTPVQAFTYLLTGATTGSGSGTASGLTFNGGITTVEYRLTGSPSVFCSFNVTVVTNVIPSVSIAASATTICAGTNVIFTATPTNGGTPAYQWKVNGTNAGTNSPTFQSTTLANGDIVTVQMTSSITCATPLTVTSNAITITVNPTVTPSVSIAATATSICSGTNVTFTATPNNGGTPSYQWKVNGSNVGTNSPTFQSATLVNNDVVTVVMTSSLTCVTASTATSNAITMTVTPSVVPSVSISASATNICSGTNVVFTATPANGGTPTYQWKVNGINTGTNSPTFQSTTLVNNDVITVVMTSSLACASPAAVTSNAITMTVTTTVTSSVSISSTATTICAGTNVIFTATPVNGGTPSYQWKVNGVNTGTNSPTFQSTTLANNDVVTVVMTSSLTCVTSATVTSNAITITVSTTVTPSVSIAATATTICAGTNVAFTATPTNGGTPSYQWKINGTNTGTNSPTFQSTTLINGDVVTVVMTSSIACAVPSTATSNAITIAVTANVTPTVSIAATATTICPGTNVTFTATPANGGTPSYQWKINGVNAGSNSPTFQSTTLLNNDVVTVVMTTSVTCVTATTANSNALTITITPPPSITTHPSGQTVFAGSNVTFSVIATGSGLTYQWRKGGTNIPAATGSSYTINGLVLGDAGNYDVVVSGTCPPPAVSNIAALVVNPVPITITTQPQSQTVCAGTNVTFTIAATGVTLTYQWQVSTAGGPFTDITGATSPSLILTAVTTAQSGNQYRCVVTNPGGTATSNPATLTVNPLTAVALGALPARICITDTLVALSAVPPGGIWSGTAVSGSAFIPLNSSIGNQTVNYTYVNNFGCTTVAPLVINVEACQERIRLLTDNAVMIYPNPNNGRFNVRINTTLYSYLDMKVYTSLGSFVRKIRFNNLQFGRVFPVNLRDLADGVYHLKISYEAGRYIEKVFKIVITH